MTKNSVLFIVIMLLAYSLHGHAQELADTLKPSVIVDIASQISASQTGFERIDALSFKRNMVLGSPDVMRTLQQRAGVAMGNEMSSGIYVRGGDGSDNLFLYDDVPLYQLGHLGGAFSVVNSDIVARVDFYKSGFPSRYGGRLSSVENIVIRQGSFDKKKTNVSLGLTDGRVTFEGPFKGGNSSYIVSARQGWMMLFAKPMLAIANKLAPTTLNPILARGNYGFTELDGKIVSKISPFSVIEYSALGTIDFLRFREDSDHSEYVGEDDAKHLLLYNSGNGLKNRWWNILGSCAWKYSPHSDFSAITRVYFTNSSSRIVDESKYTDYTMSSESKQIIHSPINDFGLKSSIKYEFSNGLQSDLGLESIFHISSPNSLLYQKIKTFSSSGKEIVRTDITDEYRNTYRTLESAAYASLEWNTLDWVTANAGVRYSLFKSGDKVYGMFDPRLSMALKASENLTFKFSYARMHQSMHRLSSTFFDLPGTCWLPSTAVIKPSRSDQYAVCVEYDNGDSFSVNIEAYYKDMDNMYDYIGEVMLFPPVSSWEALYKAQRGVSKGLEFSLAHDTGKLSTTASYTLSYSDRCFPGYLDFWFPDRYDNRHKVNLSLTYKVLNGEIFAYWCYHSGNRITLPDYFTGALPVDNVHNGHVYGFYSAHGRESEMPNNQQLPAYHRLDIGYTQRFRNSSGGNSELSVGLFNAYNRKNPLFAKMDPYSKAPRLTYISVFQIMPTLRWTREF